MSINIETVNYKNSKDLRILETVVSNWFKDPKELNLTEPRIGYPFNFKKWVELTYKESNVKSFTFKKDKWIIGIGNIRINKETNQSHALHIFIDPEYRKRGLATKMIKHLEAIAYDANMTAITINVMPKNESAIKLYKKIGFLRVESNKNLWLKFQKNLIL